MMIEESCCLCDWTQPLGNHCEYHEKGMCPICFEMLDGNDECGCFKICNPEV